MPAGSEFKNVLGTQFENNISKKPKKPKKPRSIPKGMPFIGEDALQYA